MTQPNEISLNCSMTKNKTNSHHSGHGVPTAADWEAEFNHLFKTSSVRGRACPTNNCLNNNTPYKTVEEAIKSCENVQECNEVMRYGTPGHYNYFLRRNTDPICSAADNNCSGTYKVTKHNQDNATSWGAELDNLFNTSNVRGRGCPPNNCLNDNKPYSTAGEAMYWCNHVEGCGEVMRYGTPGHFSYYLRRDTDPVCSSEPCSGIVKK